MRQKADCKIFPPFLFFAGNRKFLRRNDNIFKMIKAKIPTEMVFEPVEDAYQPLLQQTMPPAPNKEKKIGNVKFSENEKPDSQSSSSYAEALSQPPRGMSHRHRLLWLQQRRSLGLYVQCDSCNRWRYLPHVLDRYELPNQWYCSMNTDSAFASCSAPEVAIRTHEEEDLIHNEYNAGSLVLARLPGWPWWPAMVDDCPDTEQYYWLDGLSDIPTHYHVVFFDEREVSRAWIAPQHMKPYRDVKKYANTTVRHKSCRKRLEVAFTQANNAQKCSQKDRLAIYGLLTRYNGKIGTPKKIPRHVIDKFKKQMKKRYSVDFSSESSDSEIDESPKKRKVTKQKAKTNDNKKEKIPIKKTVNKRNVTLRNNVPKTNESKVDKTEHIPEQPMSDESQSKTDKYSDALNNNRYQSMEVQVDSNSDCVKSTNATSTTYVQESTVSSIPDDVITNAALERAVSPGSGDFDF